jgi:hypothetical protein
MLESIRDPANAAAVQAVAAAVQAVGALILLFVTGITIRQTKRIVSATESQAVATTISVELTQQQRHDLIRPVLHLTLLPGSSLFGAATTLRLRLQVANAGIGPAFDVRAECYDTPLRESDSGGQTAGTSPAFMRAGDVIWFDFESGGAHDWPGPGRENQIVGGILLTYRDSLDGRRITRADFVAMERVKIGQAQPYRLELRALRLDPPS